MESIYFKAPPKKNVRKKYLKIFKKYLRIFKNIKNISQNIPKNISQKTNGAKHESFCNNLQFLHQL